MSNEGPKYPFFGGTLYGMTPNGGSARKGTVFSVTTNGLKKVLYSFEKPPMVPSRLRAWRLQSLRLRHDLPASRLNTARCDSAP